MKVVFICVNYNNSKYTIDYILNVLEIRKGYDVKIIIVDNASHESDINKLNKFITDLKNNDVLLIKSSINLGYFKGLNLGINYINKSEYNFLVIGNNDLIFNSNFIEVLGYKKFNKSVLVIAPNIIRIDGVHQNPHIVNKFNFMQRLYRNLYFSNYYIGCLIYLFYNSIRSILVKQDRINNDKEQIILMGYGACYILTKNFFANYDKLDAPTFLMGEEGVLANQVKAANGVTLYCPDLIVSHYDHASIGKLPSKKLYSYSKDSFKYYKKNLKHLH